MDDKKIKNYNPLIHTGKEEDVLTPKNGRSKIM